MLVYDTFEAHMIEIVKVVFTKENTNLALIPRSLNTVLEPIVFLKYTPTQLGVAGSLLPKTIRDAPHTREVNRKKF